MSVCCGRGKKLRSYHKTHKRVGVSPDVTFQDQRMTALTDLGFKSATNTEIVSFSGHAVNSPILQEYVPQTKEMDLNARRNMGSSLTD